MSIKEHASSIVSLTLTTALASVATAMLVHSLPSPRASESVMSVVRWLGAPSVIPNVDGLIVLVAAAAWLFGVFAARAASRVPR
jgi:hypothetical protein